MPNNRNFFQGHIAGFDYPFAVLFHYHICHAIDLLSDRGSVVIHQPTTRVALRSGTAPAKTLLYKDQVRPQAGDLVGDRRLRYPR